MPEVAGPDEVQLLLLAFGDAHLTAALGNLRQLAARAFPQARPRVLVVDNSREGSFAEALDDGVVRIGGDNSQREFSGWDRGLAWLDSTLAPQSMVILANDTLARPEKLGKLAALTAARAEEARRGALVGYVDAYPRPIELFGRRLRQWVDTSLVIASHATFSRLRPLALPHADGEIFADDWRQLFREPSPLSENYRRYLRSWLLGESSDEPIDPWYAQAPLAADNHAFMRQKIRSVLCEHYLSARARELHISLVDVRAEPLDTSSG